MSKGNQTFLILLSVVVGIGLIVLFLSKLVGDTYSPAPAAHLAPAKPSPASRSLEIPSVTPAIANRAPGVVYTTDFTTPAAGWSSTHVDETPSSPQRKFLGPFTEDPVMFAIAELPPHQFIHLTFELLTWKPWNGDSANFGRDLWDMRVVGGQPLIHTTFSDCGFFEDNNEQSFPDQYPWYPTHPAWTGSASKQSLGFTSTWGQSRTFGTDSTYQFDITFPHTSPSLMLQFKSQTKQHQLKPYGFLNFKVSTVDAATSATDQQITDWWNDLAADDPIKAYHAVWSLIATGDAATKFIEQHRPPLDPSIPLNIDQTHPFKCDSFQYATPQSQQLARAIHVLEVINSAESKKLLAEIGYTGTPQGAPPNRLNRSR